MNNDVIKIQLEQLLKERGKSMYALAKETGLAYTTLWKLKEATSQGISFDVLEKICLNLKCSPNDLIVIISDVKQKETKQ
jgi:putative transcriptional regulator